MSKIIIIEDDEIIRNELMQLLQNAGYEVVVMTDFCNAANEIIKVSPDLILLDVNLPGISGLTICDEIRKQSEIPIIFVTSKNTSMDELECIMRGGDDYIAKPYQVPILMARIGAVLKRTKKEDKKEDTYLTHNKVQFDLSAGIISHEGQSVDLTKNEMKIFYCLMKNKGRIVSRTELIDFLWDNEVFIDDNTLSVNVTRIRNKLEGIGVTDFIETKRGMGYKV